LKSTNFSSHGDIFDESIDIIRGITDIETANLVDIFLKFTYFSFCGYIYEKTKGVAMVSPLSLVVENISREHFERKELDSFPHKPKWWIIYVDDVYSNWPHGETKLEAFMNHLNN
jgi:hypothetical protein